MPTHQPYVYSSGHQIRRIDLHRSGRRLRAAASRQPFPTTRPRCLGREWELAPKGPIPNGPIPISLCLFVNTGSLPPPTTLGYRQCGGAPGVPADAQVATERRRTSSGLQPWWRVLQRKGY